MSQLSSGLGRGFGRPYISSGSPSQGVIIDSSESQRWYNNTDRLLLFLIEMLERDEYGRGLLAALLTAPGDRAARGIYADYLQEKGRCLSAEMVRNGWTPGGTLEANGIRRKDT